MPLTGTGATLGRAVLAAIDAACAGATPENPASRQAAFEAWGEAVVSHIIANTVVEVESVAGVQTGAGVSGPGVGVLII